MPKMALIELPNELLELILDFYVRDAADIPIASHHVPGYEGLKKPKGGLPLADSVKYFHEHLAHITPPCLNDEPCVHAKSSVSRLLHAVASVADSNPGLDALMCKVVTRFEKELWKGKDSGLEPLPTFARRGPDPMFEAYCKQDDAIYATLDKRIQGLHTRQDRKYVCGELASFLAKRWGPPEEAQTVEDSWSSRLMWIISVIRKFMPSS